MTQAQAPITIDALYFDGRSARAQPVRVWVGGVVALARKRGICMLRPQTALRRGNGR